MRNALIALIVFPGIAAFFLWKEHGLATTGPYAHVRHPQNLGFIAIMAGFLVQWPTLLTFLMFPVMVVMYVKLARREEREAREAFGEVREAYAAQTPAFFPRLGRSAQTDHPSPGRSPA